MTHLLILWHSRTGTARALADAALGGASGGDGSTPARIVAAQDATAHDLLSSAGYLFIGPENLAGLSGVMKEMVDSLYYPLLGQIEGRPYALIIAAGSDGEGAARQWARIAAGWRLKAVAEPLIVRTGAQTAEAILAPKTVAPAALDQARDLGATLATGLALGIF